MKQKILIKVILFALSVGISSSLYAGDIKYRVADIPVQLLKDAKAVVRCEEIVVEIKSDAKVVQNVKYAITILNKNGATKADFLQPYTKNMKVSSIKAKMYDETGVEIKKNGGCEIQDYAMITRGTTYSDLRIKAIDPEQYKYPFTIEYTYEITYSEVIQFPGWNPVIDFNVAVEKSKYTLIVSQLAHCRYFERNVPEKAQIQNTPESTIYIWDLTNQEALREENFHPALMDISPLVSIAPTKINVEGFEGEFDTWTGFGQWIYQLNKDRNNLPDETKTKIRKITEGLSDDRAKIKVLYEYMQNKTRYVSIQIGLGGFQPFDAGTVDRLSYGDCKALSNYMKSLLEVAGISSKYTLALAGIENPTIYDDFPSNQFNHVILCVPLTKDTVWLECTSQRNPFNYLGKFTADRPVLVIDEKGGTLVHTPSLKPANNLVSRTANVTLNATGSGFADVKNTYHGAAYDDYLPILMSDQIDRKKLITSRIHVSNFELDNFTIQETRNELPFVTENLKLTFTGYCTKVGNKLMLCLNLMNKLSESSFQATTRRTVVSFKWPVYEIDTVTYQIPQGYSLEKIPAKVSIHSDIGFYTSEVIKTGSFIQYIRTFKVNKAEYLVERYDEIVAFFDKIVTADKNMVMLTQVIE